MHPSRVGESIDALHIRHQYWRASPGEGFSTFESDVENLSLGEASDNASSLLHDVVGEHFRRVLGLPPALALAIAGMTLL